jgi:hypothetical protein
VLEERSIIAEIEGTFASGSADKQADILRRVTNLFLAGADNYSDDHVDLFDGVISRIAEKMRAIASTACRRPRHNASSVSTTNATPRWQISSSCSSIFARRKALRAPLREPISET